MVASLRVALHVIPQPTAVLRPDSSLRPPICPSGPRIRVFLTTTRGVPPGNGTPVGLHTESHSGIEEEETGLLQNPASSFMESITCV